jgi:hypothetical protein
MRNDPRVKPWEIGDLVEIRQHCSASRGGVRVNYVPGDIGIILSLDDHNARVYVKGREEDFYLGYISQLTSIPGVP